MHYIHYSGDQRLLVELAVVGFSPLHFDNVFYLFHFTTSPVRTLNKYFD